MKTLLLTLIFICLIALYYTAFLFSINKECNNTEPANSFNFYKCKQINKTKQ